MLIGASVQATVAKASFVFAGCHGRPRARRTIERAIGRVGHEILDKNP